MPKGSNKLIIADKAYSIDWPTVSMHDEGGFNAHTIGCATGFAGAGACGPGGVPRQPAKGLEGKMQRYRARHISGNERTLRAAQAVIKQFVIHLDGCQNAGMCFDVLHNERGLSCHFVVDNDGTIYQTLDLIDCAYHASGMNETSIGVELCNRGNAVQLPNQYNYPGAIPRDEVVCFVNKEKYVAYDFTPQQYAAMEVLGKTLAKLLPGIKLDYPHAGGTSEASWDTLEPNDPTNVHLRETYSGYIGHYHITNQKWDPGPWDFKKFVGKLSGSRSFPVGLHNLGEKTQIPNKPEDKLFDAYYTNNEYDAEKAGGYYPVGPLELSQLWHGGIHIHGERGDAVVAPLPGEIVVARNGKENVNVGSTNFVLIKHTPSVTGEKLTFFTLLYHLDEEKSTKRSDRLKWMGSEDWMDAEPGRVVVLKSPEHVQANDIIGRMGRAGPEFKPQLHWEVFSASETKEAIKRLDKHGFWKEYSGLADQRVCTNPEIVGKIDVKPKDHIITHGELEDAYQGDVADHEWTRHVIASHYSEWSDFPDWQTALRNAPELLKKGKAGEREADQLFHEQIEPGLWLIGDVPQKIGLAANAPLYFYHPVSFLKFVNELLEAKDTGGLKKATAEDRKTATGKAMSDFDDKDGTSMIAKADLEKPSDVHNIELPDMVDGYGD